MAKLRILIADDHALIRRSVRILLESHSGWEVSGEAANGREAVEQSARLLPDLVITDLHMPEGNGLETIRQIRARDPEASIIVLTMDDSPTVAEHLRKAGAAAVIAKSDANERLIAAIYGVERRNGRFGGSIIPRPRHAAAFFRTKEEADAVVLAFVREGLERGERVVRLRGGHDPAADVGPGSLDALSWDEVIGDGALNADAVLGRIVQLLEDSAARGYPLTRVIAATEWMMEHNPEFRELEPRFNDVLEDLDDVLVCGYDLTKFPPELVNEALRWHPLLLVDGRLQANPGYVPASL
ncbi:MAG: two component transcriptional regulator, LuxR family [Acidobacteria bacterium]|nr:two component transcriptional regulator, LuxR family [Acidobacteriota bacterium]